MKPSTLSPKWKKNKDELASELKNRGEMYFKLQKIKAKHKDNLSNIRSEKTANESPKLINHP